MTDSESDRRWFVAGAAVLKEADADQRFRTQLRELLDRHLTADGDRALFGLPRHPEAATGGTAEPDNDMGEEDPGSDPDLRER